jgi:hypothetical protein
VLFGASGPSSIGLPVPQPILSMDMWWPRCSMCTVTARDGQLSGTLFTATQAAESACLLQHGCVAALACPADSHARRIRLPGRGLGGTFSRSSSRRDVGARSAPTPGRSTQGRIPAPAPHCLRLSARIERQFVFRAEDSPRAFACACPVPDESAPHHLGASMARFW